MSTNLRHCCSMQMTPLSHFQTTPLRNQIKVDQINDKELAFELEMVTIKVFLRRPSSLDDQMSIRSSFSGQLISHTCAVSRRVHVKPSAQLARSLCLVRRSYLKLATHKRSQTGERFPEMLTEQCMHNEAVYSPVGDLLGKSTIPSAGGGEK